MPEPETIAWLKHTASCGQASSQLMLEVLERLERLEAMGAHQLPRLEKRLEVLESAPPVSEPIDEAENDRRFHAGIKAIDKAFAQAPPAGLSLIDELAIAIGDEFSLSPLTLRHQARRAVAVIVRRLRERKTLGSFATVDWLEQEAAK